MKPLTPLALAIFVCSISGLPLKAQSQKAEEKAKEGFEVPAAAAKIDQLVEGMLAKQGVKPNEAINDATFVRRAYLDITGRVPTIEEAENFHGSDYPRKRQQLISDLLESDGHMSHAYNFWADVLA